LLAVAASRRGSARLEIIEATRKKSKKMEVVPRQAAALMGSDMMDNEFVCVCCTA
jgi:hypothetical protein